MSDRSHATLERILSDGETVLVWARCRRPNGRGLLALTSDRLLFLPDAKNGVPLEQRIAQARAAKSENGVLRLKTAGGEVTFDGIDAQMMEEILGTLGGKVTISNPEIAQRVKVHRKLMRKRALRSMRNVPKDASRPID